MSPTEAQCGFEEVSSQESRHFSSCVQESAEMIRKFQRHLWEFPRFTDGYPSDFL